MVSISHILYWLPGTIHDRAIQVFPNLGEPCLAKKWGSASSTTCHFGVLSGCPTAYLAHGKSVSIRCEILGMKNTYLKSNKAVSQYEASSSTHIGCGSWHQKTLGPTEVRSLATWWSRAPAVDPYLTRERWTSKIPLHKIHLQPNYSLITEPGAEHTGVRARSKGLACSWDRDAKMLELNGCESPSSTVISGPSIVP